MIHNRKRELYVLRLNFESILDFYCVHQETHQVFSGGSQIMNNQKSVRCGLALQPLGLQPLGLSYSTATSTGLSILMVAFIYYKFATVCQEGFLSSLPRWLSICFLSKALVSEHRALSYLYSMTMILTLPYSQDVSFTGSLHPCQLETF